jgi:hypothetical protein
VFIWSDVTDTTAGDFLYLAGVQLEAGAVATPFERRPFGTELALCMRYFQVVKGGSGGASSSTTWETFMQFTSPMRASPSAALTAAARVEDHAVTTYTQSSAAVTISNASPEAAKFVMGNFSGLTGSRYYSFAGSISGAGVLQLSSEL